MNTRSLPAISENRPQATERITRGVCRLVRDMGFSPLTEFPLGNGRRADVMGLDKGGRFLLVEVKSSPEDYRADGKWRDYLDFCDFFYFAVGADFPSAILPADCGLMAADEFQAAVLRPAPEAAVNPARRRSQILRFGRRAAGRLHRLTDPGV